MRFYFFILIIVGCTNSHNGKSAIINEVNDYKHPQTIDSIPIIVTTSSKKNWVDTEERFEDSLGRAISVFNSYPRGGAYITSKQNDAYRVFWTSIVNETTTPLKLTITFPKDSFPTFTSPTAYIKALVPPNKMMPEKVELFDFGLTNIQSILENGFKQPSKLEIILSPKEEYFYYTLFLFHESEGRTRSSLVLKGQDLFYKLNIDDHPPVIISCGHIAFMN